MPVFLTLLRTRLEIGRGIQTNSWPGHHQTSARPCSTIVSVDASSRASFLRYVLLSATVFQMMLYFWHMVFLCCLCAGKEMLLLYNYYISLEIPLGHVLTQITGKLQKGKFTARCSDFLHVKYG